MKFQDKVLEGRFLKRYKRFFADVELNGQVVIAHVPNTGSLKGAVGADLPCLVTHNADPERKLKYTLQMVKNQKSWVGVNTALPNKLVYEAWQNGLITEWEKFDRAQLETKINHETRLDLALWDSKKNSTEKITPDLLKQAKFHFVEIKNVTMADGNRALFPDAVTERGQKHLLELIKLKEQGHSCEILFVVQRQDCQLFAPADDIDPEYGKLLRLAHKKGVVISAYPCELTQSQIVLKPQSPLEINM